MDIRTVNIKKENCTHFCGRKSSYKVGITKGEDYSILGNPFSVKPWGVYTRHESIQKFKTYAQLEMKKKGEFYNKIVELTKLTKTQDIKLGCFCKPLACHCDVIISLIKLELTKINK